MRRFVGFVFERTCLIKKRLFFLWRLSFLQLLQQLRQHQLGTKRRGSRSWAWYACCAVKSLSTTLLSESPFTGVSACEVSPAEFGDNTCQAVKYSSDPTTNSLSKQSFASAIALSNSLRKFMESTFSIASTSCIRIAILLNSSHVYALQCQMANKSVSKQSRAF